MIMMASLRESAKKAHGSWQEIRKVALAAKALLNPYQSQRYRTELVHGLTLAIRHMQRGMPVHTMNWPHPGNIMRLPAEILMLSSKR